MYPEFIVFWSYDFKLCWITIDVIDYNNPSISPLKNLSFKKRSTIVKRISTEGSLACILFCRFRTRWGFPPSFFYIPKRTLWELLRSSFIFYWKRGENGKLVWTSIIFIGRNVRSYLLDHWKESADFTDIDKLYWYSRYTQGLSSFLKKYFTLTKPPRTANLIWEWYWFTVHCVQYTIKRI